MKLKLAIVILVLEAVVLFTFSAVGAECNPGDLFCQGWTPNQQEQKVRIEDMESFVAAHSDLLAKCDQACIDNYNNSTNGLLKTVADKKNLPYNQFVLYAISLNWEWGNRATDAYKRPLVLKDWQNHYAWGWNELAASLTINPVMRIWDDAKYCVNQEYDGICPGLW